LYLFQKGFLIWVYVKLSFYDLNAVHTPKTLIHISSRLFYNRRSVGQSVSASSPIWGSRPDFCYCQTVAGLLMWGALSDEGMGLSFTIAAGPRQRSHSQARVPRGSRLYFALSDLRLPQPGGRVPVFTPPGDRVAQLYHKAPGSLFVASYDSQGYGGGIRTRLHRFST
jgi:hypothetical protein